MLLEHTGFQANTERTQGSYSKYSGIDDRMRLVSLLHNINKVWLRRASYDAAQEIRNKKITREEGVNLVKKYDDEFPIKYFKDFLEYIDISESIFRETIDKFRPTHLWKKENGEWALKNKIWEI